MIPRARLAPAAVRGLGALTFGLAASALIARTAQRAQTGSLPATQAQLPAPLRRPGLQHPAQGLHAAAALLAASVLADSAVGHARGSYANPGMFAPLLTAGAALLAGTRGALRAGPEPAQRRVYRTALLVGAAGAAFHLYNVFARPGRFSWGNLFYGAPLGAPAALSLAGTLGLGALRTAAFAAPQQADARRLCAIVSAGLAGASADVALRHFRGAYHNPFMWLPVTVTPLAAAALAGHAGAPARIPRRAASAWLAATGLLGIGGIGFHAYGVARQMGGWRNWRQNVLSGPPLGAPPSLTALALGGICALALLDNRRRPA
jgi:hypothetical protein